MPEPRTPPCMLCGKPLVVCKAFGKVNNTFDAWTQCDGDPEHTVYGPIRPTEQEAIDAVWAMYNNAKEETK